MRHYLDHAATSWPRLPGVVEASQTYDQTYGAAAGRGGYRTAFDADRIVQSTRRLIAEYLNAASVTEIAFCANGTHALNAAIMGLALGSLGNPFHVVCTATEHNSVLRPLALAAQRGWLTWTAVPCSPEGTVPLSEIEQAITPGTRWVVINHGSNVTGTIQNIGAIRKRLEGRGIGMLVDAAQTLGMIPIDVRALGIDILAAPGHKGLGGVFGTGILYARQEIHELLSPLWIGGTGETSDKISGNFPWHSAIESGNINVPAIAALQAGMTWKINHQAPDYESWIAQLLDAVADCKNIQGVGLLSRSLQDRLPIVSVVPKTAHLRKPGICQEMAMMLESMAHVECRAGFHCAGAIHPYLDTFDSGGTLRMSLGAMTQQADVDAACEGLRQLDSVL
jgi:cysteine desulfurase/selenocysteine lyase